VDQILLNLKDPSWWFTGVFFILVGLFITKFIFNWLPTGYKHISNRIPFYGNMLSRRIRLDVVKAIKRNRQYELKVHWEIAKFWSLATVTLIYTFFAAVIFLIYPKPEDGGIKYQFSVLMLFFPGYVLQALTLIYKRRALQLITARIRWQKRLHQGSK